MWLTLLIGILTLTLDIQALVNVVMCLLDKNKEHHIYIYQLVYMMLFLREKIYGNNIHVDDDVYNLRH